MKHLITNNLVLVFLAFICVGTGIAFSFVQRDFMWLARSGAVVVGIGIVALSRTFILKKDLLLEVAASDKGENVNGPEYYRSRGEPTPSYVEEDQRSRFALGVVGPVLSFMGSLIWGFSDLFNKLFTGFWSNCV